MYIKSRIESSKHDNHLSYDAIESINWFYNVGSLMESLHRFEGCENSEYRKALDKIVNGLFNNKPVRENIQLIHDSSSTYNLFEFHNLFQYVENFPKITTLKVYFEEFERLNFNANPDAFCICSPYVQSIYNINEYPLYKSAGTVIDVMTIVISDFNDKGHILNAIAHEMKHALSLICNDKLYLRIDRDNEACENFHEITQTFTGSPSTSPFRGKRWVRVYEWFEQFSYYCQPTEIESHLESAYYEIKDTQLSRKKVLMYLKNPLSTDNQLAKISPTLSNYIALRNIAELLLSPECLEAMNREPNIHHRDLILNTIYKSGVPKRATLKTVFLKWKSGVDKFLKEIQQILYAQYKPES